MKINQKLIKLRQSQLLQEKERLEKEIKSLREVTEIDYGYTEDDNTQEVVSLQNTIGLINSLEKMLKKINGALKRIDEGNFGVCDACGASIESARLEVSPETNYCAACIVKKK